MLAGFELAIQAASTVALGAGALHRAKTVHIGSCGRLGHNYRISPMFSAAAAVGRGGG